MHSPTTRPSPHLVSLIFSLHIWSFHFKNSRGTYITASYFSDQWLVAQQVNWPSSSQSVQEWILHVSLCVRAGNLIFLFVCLFLQNKLGTQHMGNEQDLLLEGSCVPRSRICSKKPLLCFFISFAHPAIVTNNFFTYECFWNRLIIKNVSRANLEAKACYATNAKRGKMRVSQHKSLTGFGFVPDWFAFVEHVAQFSSR